MSDLTSNAASEIFAACQAGAEKAAEALSQTFETPCEIAPGEPAPCEWDSLAGELEGGGLAIILHVGESAAVLLIPASANLLPNWARQAEADTQTKLDSLAQELAPLLLPDDLSADNAAAVWLDDLPSALQRGEPAEELHRLLLECASGETTATLSLIWPLTAPAAIASPEQQNSASDDPPSSEQFAEVDPLAAMRAFEAPSSLDDAFQRLPSYMRSLLRVPAPVAVTLAATKLPVRKIIELGPGSLIQFDKSCEETLRLEVGSREFAEGEAVKVGDKFGLRLTKITLPRERFRKVGDK